MTYYIPDDVKEQIKLLRDLESMEKDLKQELEVQKLQSHDPDNFSKIQNVYNKIHNHYKRKENIIIYSLAKLNEALQNPIEQRKKKKTHYHKKPVVKLTKEEEKKKKTELYYQKLQTQKEEDKKQNKKQKKEKDKTYSNPNLQNKRIMAKGTNVVAFSEKDKEWISCKIVKYDHTQMKYIIEDVDEDESGKIVKSQQLVSEKKVFKLNLEDNAWTKRLKLKKGNVVLAIYPNTTTFYPGFVISGPPNKTHGCYTIKFDDDVEFPNGRTVRFNYVIPAPPEVIQERKMKGK